MGMKLLCTLSFFAYVCRFHVEFQFTFFFPIAFCLHCMLSFHSHICFRWLHTTQFTQFGPKPSHCILICSAIMFNVVSLFSVFFLACLFFSGPYLMCHTRWWCCVWRFYVLDFRCRLGMPGLRKERLLFFSHSRGRATGLGRSRETLTKHIPWAQARLQIHIGHARATGRTFTFFQKKRVGATGQAIVL